MSTPNSDRLVRSCIRFEETPLAILQSLVSETPLYVHAAIRMAGLCAMVPLRDLMADHTGTSVGFPEDGLHVSLGEIDAIHAVDLASATGPVLSAEFAIHGETRALAIAAIPNLSDENRFRRSLDAHDGCFISPKSFRSWQTQYARKPALCPCCAEAAENRRAQPERNPLTRIIRHAIAEKLPLRCSILSSAYGFTAWLTPTNLLFSEGYLEVIGADNTTMMEIDPGLCHSLLIVRESLDGERFSTMKVLDSTGSPHLSIATTGWECETLWRKFCEPGN